MQQINTNEPVTKKREVRVGKTLVSVTSVYHGKQELDRVLFDWAVKKTVSAIKN